MVYFYLFTNKTVAVAAGCFICLKCLKDRSVVINVLIAPPSCDRQVTEKIRA